MNLFYIFKGWSYLNPCIARRSLLVFFFSLLKFVKQKLCDALITCRFMNSIVLNKSIFSIYFRFVIAQTLRKHQLDRATIRLPINITSIALPNLNQPPWLVWWYTYIEIIKVNSHIKTKLGFTSWLKSLVLKRWRVSTRFFCWLPMLLNRRWHISATPNTTKKICALFKLIQRSNMVTLSCLAKKNQNLNLRKKSSVYYW